MVQNIKNIFEVQQCKNDKKDVELSFSATKGIEVGQRDCEKQRGKVEEWTQLGSKSFLGEAETIEVEEEEATMASIPLGDSSAPEGQS